MRPRTRLTITLIVPITLSVFALAAQARECESEVFKLTQLGKQLFNENAVCYSCHGRNADGKTDLHPRVAELDPKPTDLKDAAALKYPTDEARYSVIRNGIAGTGMPAFRGSLDDKEIRLIIEYLEALKTGGC